MAELGIAAHESAVTAAWLFWLSIALVAYSYLGYPLLARALARRIGSTPHAGTDGPPLTVVIPVHNEQGRIGERIRDVLAQDYPAPLRVLVACDGSDDDTARIAAGIDPRVTVLDLPQRRGKAAALNDALAKAETELVAFTDARQRFAPGALQALAGWFADDSIGAVSGSLEIAPSAGHGAAAGVGLYWRLEKQLRRDEARLGWLHGVSGSIHAVRRALFRPLPADTILDDMWIPMQVLLSGHRVWMTDSAVAFDQASGSAREEFDRKLRTLAGNWQLLARLPVLLHPRRNPVFFAWCSHKLLRLIAPWLLLAALVSSALAPGPLYRFALVAQLAAYVVAVAALRWPRAAARIPLLPAAGTFLMLNLAALLALPASLAWHPSRLWKKH
jgi:cellulose synthase/poly-beta-1,6-N-acetylglucosamine synthase-like glycosyltransferase